MIAHDQITPGELPVLQLLTQGLSNSEIADQLFISESTVKKHVSRILDKLQVGSRTEAATLTATSEHRQRAENAKTDAEELNLALLHIASAVIFALDVLDFSQTPNVHAALQGGLEHARKALKAVEERKAK